MLLSPELTLAQAADRTVVLRFDDIFLFMIFIGWLAKLAVFKELNLLKKTVLNIPIRNYIFVCVLATAMGLLTRQQSLARSFFYLLKYFEYFMLYFLVVNNIENVKEVKIFVFLMIFTCLVVSIYALYSHFGMGLRATAPFEGKEGEPNTLAGYLVILMALCMGLLFHLKNMRIRMGLLLVLLAAFMALLFSLSRGGWLSFIFMYLAMIVLVPRYRAFLILGMACMIAFAPIIFPGEVKTRFAATFERSAKSRTFKVAGKNMAIDESGSYRLNSLAFGYRELLESPLVGHGVPTLALVDTQFTRVMIETGALGLWAFGFLLLRIFSAGRYCLWKARQAQDGFMQGLAVGFQAGFVGLIVHCFSAASFIIVRIMEPFWFLAALVVSMSFLVPLPKQEQGAFIAEGT